jgi:putative addiction module CopG family antidote
MSDHKIRLPDELARFAQAGIDAGRYRDLDEAVQAGLRALEASERAEAEWLRYAREATAEAFAAFDRGEGMVRTPEQFMDRVRARVDS